MILDYPLQVIHVFHLSLHLLFDIVAPQVVPFKFQQSLFRYVYGYATIFR